MDSIIKTIDLHKSFPLGNHEILEVLNKCETVDIANAVMARFTPLENFLEISENYWSGHPFHIIHSRKDLHQQFKVFKVFKKKGSHIQQTVSGNRSREEQAVPEDLCKVIKASCIGNRAQLQDTDA